MANEINFHATTATTSWYFAVQNKSGQYWNTNTAAFENPNNTALVAGYYYIAATEFTSTGVFSGTFPSAIAVGDYAIIPIQQAGGAAAATDPKLGSYTFKWSGAAEMLFATGLTTIGTVNTTLGTVNTNVGTVNTTLGTVNTNVGTVTTNLATVNTTLGTVNTNVGTVNTNLSTVNTTLGTVNTNVSTLYNNANTYFPLIGINSQMMVLHSSTAQAGASSTTIVLNSAASSVDNFYQFHTIVLVGSPTQSRQIVSYVGSTRTATVDSAWNANPVNGDTYLIGVASRAVIDSSGFVKVSSGTGSGQLNTTSGVIDSNVTKISGSAVSTTTAQLGVNAVKLGNTVQTGHDLGAGVLLDTATDLYYAAVTFIRDDSAEEDHYLVELTKNGVEIAGTITVPKLFVYNSSDYSTLINNKTLTLVNGARYRYDASTTERQTAGVGCFTTITATVDGTPRTFLALEAGRDST